MEGKTPLVDIPLVFYEATDKSTTDLSHGSWRNIRSQQCETNNACTLYIDNSLN